MDCKSAWEIPDSKVYQAQFSSQFSFWLHRRTLKFLLALKDETLPCPESRSQGGVFPLLAGRPSAPLFPHVVTAINWHCYQITLGTQALFYISVSQCRKYSNSAETWLFWQVVLHWVTINMSFFDCVRVCRERGIRLCSALLGLNWQRFDNVCRIIRWNQSQVEEAPQLSLNKILYIQHVPCSTLY